LDFSIPEDVRRIFPQTFGNYLQIRMASYLTKLHRSSTTFWKIRISCICSTLIEM